MQAAQTAPNPFTNGAVGPAPATEAPKKKKVANNSPLSAMEGIKRVERIFRRLSPASRRVVTEVMANSTEPSPA